MKWFAGTVLVGAAGILSPLYLSQKLETARPIENLEIKTVRKTDLIDYKTDDFSEQEYDIINYTADRVGVKPALLMAIRKAENGREGLEFGIIPTKAYEEDKGIFENGKIREYNDEFEKQASWCAWTIKKNLERYKNSDFNGDFISFLQKKYCPIGAENDPKGLNKNWENNVRFYLNIYKTN